MGGAALGLLAGTVGGWGGYGLVSDLHGRFRPLSPLGNARAHLQRDLLAEFSATERAIAERTAGTGTKASLAIGVAAGLALVGAAALDADR